MVGKSKKPSLLHTGSHPPSPLTIFFFHLASPPHVEGTPFQDPLALLPLLQLIRILRIIITTLSTPQTLARIHLHISRVCRCAGDLRFDSLPKDSLHSQHHEISGVRH
ncbi:hypothetical protein ABW19_dt0201594 [Dactylella cylindrospora]|nr:hypothetical protein ABW19_dt0201594 [Dactylella cylindrospora]